MPDREKVIEGLERCKPAWFTVCNCTSSGECPYNKFGHNEGGCVDHLIDDALALLREQDELLHKKQTDINNLCIEISKLKHKAHDKPLKEGGSRCV